MTARSAQGKATPWLAPIGRPKAWRSEAYAVAWSRQACDHAGRERGDGHASLVEDLEELSESLAALAQEVVDAGTRQSVKVRPWVSEACQPILR